MNAALNIAILVFTLSSIAAQGRTVIGAAEDDGPIVVCDDQTCRSGYDITTRTGKSGNSDSRSIAARRAFSEACDLAEEALGAPDPHCADQNHCKPIFSIIHKCEKVGKPKCKNWQAKELIGPGAADGNGNLLFNWVTVHSCTQKATIKREYICAPKACTEKPSNEDVWDF